MHDFWVVLSMLGNSKWLLPAACILVLCAGEDRWRIGLRWFSGLAVVCAITLASKLAFMGWGFGSRALDFTGFSGHAAVSSAIYPVALSLLAGQRWRWWGAGAGVLLALLIAYSRLPLHAHSVSEVVAGLALGLTGSLWYFARTLEAVRSKFVACAVAVALSVAASHMVAPGVGTHDLVMKLAQSMSGRDVLYNRAWLHRAG